MQTQPHVSDWAAGLPADLWVRVLSQVVSDKQAPRIEALSELSIDRTVDFGRKAAGPYTACQAQAHSLLLVCRRIRDLLQQAQPLSQTIVLRPDLTIQTCRSLQLWLQCNGASVHRVAAFSSGPQLKPALTALLQATPRLAEVLVTNCCTQTVQLLSSLSRITVCEIESLTDVKLDALQALKSLHTLTLLHGCYEAKQLPPHLTALGLYRAHMTSETDCKCVTSLKSLSVVHSNLDGLHEQGLPACLHISTVHCCFGIQINKIQAGHNEIFSTDLGCYLMSAQHLSPLTCMKDLSLIFGWTPPIRKDISPLYALTSLESLWLQFLSSPSARPIQIGATFTALHRLSQIYLETVQITRGVVLLDVPWDCMPALHSLTLRGCRLGCNERVLGLSRLTALRCLNILDCRSHDADSAECIAQLMHNLQQHCPWLDLSVDANFGPALLALPISNRT